MPDSHKLYASNHSDTVITEGVSARVTLLRPTTTECAMGQTLSELSHATSNSNSSNSSTAASGRTKWKAREATRRLRVGGSSSKRKPTSDQFNGNPMKNKVLSCLGRRKRDPSETDVDSGCESGAGPAPRREHRVGKLPRDEVVSTVGESRASLDCLDAQPAVDLGIDRENAAGESHPRGREAVQASGGANKEPKPGREDNESDPQTRAMEDQPLVGENKDCIVSAAVELRETSPSAAPQLTSDPHAKGTSSTSSPDQPPGDKRLLSGDETAAKMTKTDSSAVSCPSKAPGDQTNGCPVETKSRQGCEQAQHGPPGGQSYPGTIPKLIITRDPSPTRSSEPPSLLGAHTELSVGSYLVSRADDESPCSDSGCGGSPALMRSPRKLSNSSSIGLSSASSFEESEDDFTGSDIESSLSPRSACSPDDGAGVSVKQTAAEK